MIDEPDDILDYRVANHIVAVHQRQDQAFDVPYTMNETQLYLKYARAHKPELTQEVSHLATQSSAFMVHGLELSSIFLI